jgi:hypothetical protein
MELGSSPHEHEKEALELKQWSAEVLKCPANKGLCSCNSCNPLGLAPIGRTNFIQLRSAKKHWHVEVGATLSKEQYIGSLDLFAEFIKFSNNEITNFLQPVEQVHLGSVPSTTANILDAGSLPIGRGRALEPFKIPDGTTSETDGESLGEPIHGMEEEVPCAQMGAVHDDVLNFKPCYNSNGTRIGHYVEAAQRHQNLFKNDPASLKKEMMNSLPGSDGSTTVKLSTVLEQDDQEDDQIVMLVATLVLQKVANCHSHKSFSDNVQAWLPALLPEFQKIMESIDTYPKALSFLEKHGAGLRMVEYHVCGNANCSHVYRTTSRNDVFCPNPKCGAPRLRPEDNKPYRRMYYLPVQDWLVRLRSTNHINELMNWWVNDRPVQEGVQTDVYDTPLWSIFKEDPHLGDFCK